MMGHLAANEKLTTGQALSWLRRINKVNNRDLLHALQTSNSVYLKIERDQRDLSFIMAVKPCKFYNLTLNDFAAMLTDDELQRKD